MIWPGVSLLPTMGRYVPDVDEAGQLWHVDADVVGCVKAGERCRAHPASTATCSEVEMPIYPITCTVSGCSRPSNARGLCNGHYASARKAGTLPPLPTSEDRFWEKVNKNGPVHPTLGTPCWVWTACTIHGYGQIKYRNKVWLAHRLSWLFEHGELPEGLGVLHKCDNPPCVRPEHLYVGTQTDNTRDMKERGRAATGDRHGSKTHPERVRRGSNHPMTLNPALAARGDRSGGRTHPERVARGDRNGQAKITEADVRAIRAAFATGERNKDLAARFRLSPASVSEIVHYKQWAHIDPEIAPTDLP